MMAVGVKYKCTVGEVEGLHNAEVRELISEMAIATEKVTVISNIKFFDFCRPVSFSVIPSTM
jgi:hypothetical protein